jgi:hypothetical protein
MPQLLYPMGIVSLVLLEYEGFVDARTGLDALDFGLEMNLLLLKGYEPLYLGYPDRSILH